VLTTAVHVNYIDGMFYDHVKAYPERLIGDKAYDSDPLDVKLAVDYGIELIAPHRLSWRVAEDAGRATVASLQTSLEDRTAVCLAAEFPSRSGTL